ncbi:MAG TPA: hypothetical protein DC054_14705 [Blastocatellia bacterium]|nr:hypothetical protein [Blastocatellia bacterium]
MQIKDASEALSKLLGKATEQTEIESVHQAQFDLKELAKVVADPRSVISALGLSVSKESQIHVTLKQRPERTPSTTAMRRIIIIVIKYRNCDADIIIIVS